MSVESIRLKSSLKGMPILIYVRAWKQSTTPLVQTKVFFQGVVDGPAGKRLQLRIPDATWRQEMTFQKQTLLKRYCDACLALGLRDFWLPIECHIVAW